MMEFGSTLAVAVRLGRILEESQIPYYVGGSVASSIHGEPSFSNNIDVIVDMMEHQLDTLLDRLKPGFLVDEVSMRAELRRRGSWSIIDKSTDIKIDLFFAPNDSLQRSTFARRVRVEVTAAGETIYLASPEDMVLHKLLWFQKADGVSERQWRDVVQMIRLATKMDFKYLDQWADWLDIVALWHKARKEAEAPHKKGF